jgi:nucleotide-binding universal stress UspA family protein
MAKRIMMVVTPDTGTEYARAALDVARAARQSSGRVRIVYVSPIPPPRVDRYDRVVADTDREIERIAATAEEELRVMASYLGGVPVERVVRFGRLPKEMAIEAEVFGADLITLTTPARPALRQRVLAWCLGRLLVPSRVLLILVPPPITRAAGRSREDLAAAALR